jgi:hypothetical protein
LINDAVGAGAHDPADNSTQPDDDEPVLDDEDIACLGMRRERDPNDPFEKLLREERIKAFEEYIAELPKPEPPGTDAPVAIVRLPTDPPGTWALQCEAREAALGIDYRRQRKPRKPRSSDVSKQIKQVEKVTGKRVTGATVAPDGTVAFTFGQPSADSETNPWDEALRNAEDAKRSA